MRRNSVGAATAAAPDGFLGWITTYGSVIGFFVQIAYYVVVAASVAWAAAMFTRYVRYMTSTEEIVFEAEKPVDEFVE
jgi:hypothetical protein